MKRFFVLYTRGSEIRTHTVTGCNKKITDFDTERELADWIRANRYRDSIFIEAVNDGPGNQLPLDKIEALLERNP
jgi:hypothetical protein